MNENQVAVLVYVREHCKGRTLARKVNDIANDLNMKSSSVRAVVQELRTFHAQPICSTFKQPAGLYWPTTQDELAAALDELRARRDSMSQTIAAIEKRHPQQARHQRRPAIVPRPQPRLEEPMTLPL